MRRHPLVTTFAATLLAVALGSAWTAAAGPDQEHQDRLVVFEYFDSTCATCVEAGEALDRVALEYEEAGRPVVFIEYASSDTMGNRLDRWYQACPDWRRCYLPLELVDSGWRWSCGPKNHRAIYLGLVQEALGNPAGADLTAHYARSGRTVDVHVQVMNRSGRALGPDNQAALIVIVYEKVKVMNTSRFARAAIEVPLEAPLPDGSQGNYRIELPAPAVARWDRAVVVALLDYRPDPSSERRESLQAAIATEGLPATATPRISPTTPATATVTPSPTATATAGPSPTATSTPVWLAPPRFVPLVMRSSRSR